MPKKILKDIKKVQIESNNKKVIGIISIVAISIVLMTTQIAYATNNNQTIHNEEFFSADKNEAAKGETITMTIDLNKVAYTNFKFTLSSDNSDIVENVNTNLSESNNKSGNELISKNEETNNVINSNEQNDTVTIEATKDKLEINKIELYYKIPETAKIGDKIVLIGKIENTDSITINNRTANEIKNNSGENVINNTIEEVNTNSNEIKIEISVVEKSQNESASDNSQQNNQNNQNNLQNGISSSEMQDKNENSMTTTVAKNVSSATSGSTKITDISTTYAGSYNNYLSDIKVNGYTITPNFTITNSTYFLIVENSTTSVDVETEKMDSSSDVKIYGNTDLKVGINKILISVTAENGNVRIYRIYVTRNA